MPWRARPSPSSPRRSAWLGGTEGLVRTRRRVGLRLAEFGFHARRAVEPEHRLLVVFRIVDPVGAPASPTKPAQTATLGASDDANLVTNQLGADPPPHGRKTVTHRPAAHPRFVRASIRHGSCLVRGTSFVAKEPGALASDTSRGGAHDQPTNGTAFVNTATSWTQHDLPKRYPSSGEGGQHHVRPSHSSAAGLRGARAVRIASRPCATTGPASRSAGAR
jgi:hypothetical protein